MTVENTAPETVSEEISDSGEVSESIGSVDTPVESGDKDYDAWLNSNDDADDDEIEENVDEEPVADSDKEEVADTEDEPVADIEEWNLKVDGEDVVYNPSDVEATKSWVQKGMAAQKTWQEAAKIRNQANQFIQTLQGGTESVKALLSNPSLGVNLVELAEEVLYEEMNRPEQTPEQIKFQEEKKAFEAQKRQEEDRIAQEKQRVVENTRNQLKQDISKNLEASHLPQNDWTIQRTAHYLKMALDGGYQNISPADVMQYVKQDFIQEQRNLFSSMPADKLMEVLGEDTANKLREQNIAKVKQQNARQAKTVQKSSDKKPTKKYRSVTEYLQNADK